MAKRKRRGRIRDNDSGKDAKLESASNGKPLEAKTNPRFTAQVDIYVDHYRTRLIDPENLSTKAVTDALVRAAILSDDGAKEIKEVRHRQIKVEADSQQKTVVMIREVRG